MKHLIALVTVITLSVVPPTNPNKWYLDHTTMHQTLTQDTRNHAAYNRQYFAAPRPMVQDTVNHAALNWLYFYGPTGHP